MLHVTCLQAMAAAGESHTMYTIWQTACLHSHDDNGHGKALLLGSMQHAPAHR